MKKKSLPAVSKAAGYASVSKSNSNATDAVKLLFKRLARSKFRSSFKLATSDLEYVKTRGRELIRQHAEALLRKRIAPSHPKNDGKQTPFKGHPVFVAQHGTAYCCRKCVAKWHMIPEGRVMTETEIVRAVDVMMRWIEIDVFSKIGCETMQKIRKK